MAKHNPQNRSQFDENMKGLEDFDEQTLLDRLNPLYPSDYRFRNVYMMSVAAEDDPHVPERAVSGLQGWVDCFEHAELADTLFLGGIGNAGEAAGMEEKLQKAYEFGKQIQ